MNIREFQERTCGKYFKALVSLQGILGCKYCGKMAADLDNGMDLSGFIVDKGIEAENDKTEEVAEISLSPDLEAEEERKAELREQANKVRDFSFDTSLTCWNSHDFLIVNINV